MAIVLALDYLTAKFVWVNNDLSTAAPSGGGWGLLLTLKNTE